MICAVMWLTMPCMVGCVSQPHTLAIKSSADARPLKGTETREPTYGLPAIWIADSEKELARAARYTLVDAQTVFITHLSEVLKQQSAALLTRAETDKLLARIREQQAGLVEEIVPTVLSVGDIQKVLQNLLKEKVSIRNLELILETLVEGGRQSKDIGYLTEAVRQRLGTAICQALIGENGVLQVLTLEPATEQALMKGIKTADGSSQFVLEPKLMEQLLARLAQQCDKMMKANLLPVLLCAPDLRRHVRLLAERSLPHLRVLSMAEVPGSTQLKAFAPGI